MKMTPDIAAQFYAEARPATRAGPQDGGGGDAARFAAMAQDTIAALSDAEATVKAGLTGRADPQAVVQALAETEVAVQTAVAVRDRIVEAYQEILRMPV